jgi:hypothetical protein
MDSEGSSDQGARFQFIDISSTNARKEARAHVMREFMRQKREEQPNSQKPKKARKRSKKPAEQSTRNPNDTVEKKDSSAGETESDASVTVQKSTVPETSSHRGDGETALVRRPSMRLSTSRSRSGSPQSMVDASRRDPFQSLPMWLDEEDRPLVDHCQLSP